jgi:Emfourin
MRRRCIVDSETLAESDARELQRLLAATNLRHLHRDGEPIAPGPDMFYYRISVEDGAEKYTVRVSDVEMSEEVRRLVAWLREKASA